MSYVLTEKDEQQLLKTLKRCKNVEDTLQEYFKWKEDPCGESFFQDDYTPKDFQLMVRMFQERLKRDLEKVFPEHLNPTDDEWNEWKNRISVIRRD